MNLRFLRISLIVAVLSTGSAVAIASQPITIGLYKTIKQEREVRNFTGVAAGGPLHVVVTLGNTEGLRFEGDAEAISTLITEVKSNILVIRPQNSWTSWARKYQGKKITAYVTAKTLKSLTMSGNGSITVNGKIRNESLAATVSGSGTITADADLNDFTGVISGSGNLNFSGKAENSNIVVSGSGSFSKKGFATNHLTSVISGSGVVNITVHNHIEAVISGSGSINYSGNAQVEKRVTGSGAVRKI